MDRIWKRNALEDKLRQNETIYRAACAAFGGTPRVFRYYDQSDEISADLLTVEDQPGEGLVSYSTLGLIHHSIGLRRDDKPLRVELAGCCQERFEYYPNLLSACAFDVMNSHFAPAVLRPDGGLNAAARRDIVNTYVQGSPMKHLLFLPTALAPWSAPLPPVSFTDKNTIWLAALPLSDAELRLWEAEGTETLLRSLDAAKLSDLARPCALNG